MCPCCRVERWLLCRSCGVAWPCVEQGGVTASVRMCIPLSGSKMSWNKTQQPYGGFLCFRFEPSSVLSLLKLVLVWAGESLGFSVPPRHRPGPWAAGELLGKQNLQQQLLTRRYFVLERLWQQSDKCSVKPTLTGLMLQPLLSSAGAVPVRAHVSPPMCI